MQLNEQVGQRLRALREEGRLSLSELARRSGVGKATLSELEVGRRNPTLETLYALTTALGVPLSTVLADPPGAAVAHGGGRHVAGASGEAVTALLVERHEDASAVTEVFRVSIKAGGLQRSGPHLPGTEEHLYVLSGTAVVGETDSPGTAGPGAHVRWRADRPHVYGAPDGEVEGVLFIRYPAGAGGTGGTAGAGGTGRRGGAVEGDEGDEASGGR